MDRGGHQFQFARLEIDSLVDVFITADNCPHPKPSPVPYLMALHELRVEPDHATLFEVASALALGPKALYILGKPKRSSVLPMIPSGLNPIFIDDFSGLSPE